MQAGDVLGMDIGGTNMRFGLLNEKMELRAFAIESTQEVFQCVNPIEKLTERVRAYCEKNLGGAMPKALCIGFPSTIDKERRVVTSTPNIKPLQNLRVADEMEEALGIPVYINRDVNFLLLYDMAFHKLPEEGTVIGLYAGTGLGNAVAIDGKLLLGKNGVAAELGHIPMWGQDGLCGCGNRGCLETIASGVYLEKLQRDFFPETPIHDLFQEKGDAPQLRQFIENLSLPIATEINIFDPDYIILGGGLLQMPSFPREQLLSCIRAHTRKPYPCETLEILYSQPRQENGVIGAGIYARKRLEDPAYR